MKKNLQQIFASGVDLSNDPHRYVLTRRDLELDELLIYSRYLRFLKDPTPEQLRMLTAFSYIMIEIRKARGNKDLSDYLQRCLIYSQNRLGFWKPEPISALELMLDCRLEWPPVYLALSFLWEIVPKE